MCLLLTCCLVRRCLPHPYKTFLDASPDAGAKRQRLNSSGRAPPSPRLHAEVDGWVASLDEPSSIGLFEKALFTLLADMIRAQPALRDELLTAYVQRQ